MWKRLFEILFPERLGRLNFFWRELALSFWLVAQLATIEDHVGGDDFVPSLLILLASLLYLTVFVRLPRVYDAGMRPPWVLLTLVPFVSYGFGIVLLCKRPEPRIEGKLWPPSESAGVIAASERDPEK